MRSREWGDRTLSSHRRSVEAPHRTCRVGAPSPSVMGTVPCIPEGTDLHRELCSHWSEDHRWPMGWSPSGRLPQGPLLCAGSPGFQQPVGGRGCGPGTGHCLPLRAVELRVLQGAPNPNDCFLWRGGGEGRAGPLRTGLTPTQGGEKQISQGSPQYTRPLALFLCNVQMGFPAPTALRLQRP